MSRLQPIRAPIAGRSETAHGPGQTDNSGAVADNTRDNIGGAESFSPVRGPGDGTGRCVRGPVGGGGGMVERQGTRRRVTSGVLGQLNAEWAVLADDPVAGDSCRRWASAAPALTGCRTLGEVLAAVRTDPDAVLAALLGAAAAGETLAARAVLQAMLGKVVRMARADPRATADDYVAVLWCVVATYPLAARPHRVAANLALDTLKGVQREGNAGERALGPDAVARLLERRPGPDPGPAAGVTAAGVIGTAEQRRLLDPATGAVLRTVYVDGLPGRAAARRHRISPTALRVRCSRGVGLLARHADLLAEPA